MRVEVLLLLEIIRDGMYTFSKSGIEACCRSEAFTRRTLVLVSLTDKGTPPPLLLPAPAEENEEEEVTGEVMEIDIRVCLGGI